MSDTLQVDSEELSLVESDAEFFAKTGPLPLHWNDERRFPRFYYRSRLKAVLYPSKDQPDRQPTVCEVLLRDLSRGGISLLHTQQLFPHQRLDVTLADGKTRAVKVVWCRRMTERCYAVGAEFFKCESNSAVAESSNRVVT
jgi:hypothetical protein